MSSREEKLEALREKQDMYKRIIGFYKKLEFKPPEPVHVHKMASSGNILEDFEREYSYAGEEDRSRVFHEYKQRLVHNPKWGLNETQAVKILNRMVTKIVKEEKGEE